MPLYRLTDVYVGGKRVSGTASGTDGSAALRRFIARIARERGLRVDASIAAARQIGGHKIDVIDREVMRQVDLMLPDVHMFGHEDNFVDWPAMKPRRKRSPN